MSRFCPALVLLLALGAAAPALAHKVNVFALASGGTVSGEAYFSGGAKAQDAAVEIADPSGRVVAKGRTGADGTFSLVLPDDARAPLTVTLKAGEGHQGSFVLKETDQPARQPARETAVARQDKAAPASPADGPTGSLAPAAVAAPVSSAPSVFSADDDARLAALVEAATARAVEEKLAPLRVSLARLSAKDEDARLRDIIGGLGWIMGLVGLAAWFKR